ncbi:MAG: hypothetical protein G01um101420_265 [Parcubacteria group bacterium Gr01-1014_20]|nr:MAG: hypothetical protein G01um101420_265 [Parcubacteria group bacterium Gr01-1014_20]
MFELKQYKELSTSATALIIANFVPLVGVIFFGWSLFLILFLYWAESAVIGFFNVLKMLTAANTLKPNQEDSAGIMLKNARRIPLFLLKTFLIGFFIFHYGVFMLVHLSFIIVLFSPWSPFAVLSSQATGFEVTLPNLIFQILYPILFLFVSHGISYYVNFRKRGEYLIANLPTLFGEPYARIILMHLVIILSGFAITFVGGGMIPLMTMVILKTIFDLKAHAKERTRFTPQTN